MGDVAGKKFLCLGDVFFQSFGVYVDVEVDHRLVTCRHNVAHDGPVLMQVLNQLSVRAAGLHTKKDPDGECDEGSVWEAVLFAAHHKLAKLTVIVDYNKIQSLAPVSETLALEPFVDKWQSFGWSVERVDGHDHVALRETLARLPHVADRPTCIIADTVKGKGVSFMENQVLWHYRNAQDDELEAALAELGEAP